MYKKLEYNMPELIPLSLEQMDRLAHGLGLIAALTEGDAIASGRVTAKRYESVDDLFADMD